MIRADKISTLMDYVISVFTVLALLSVQACKENHNRTSETSGTPERGLMKHSERLLIEKTDSCTILTIIDPWQGASDVRNIYYLVKRGSRVRIPAAQVKNIIEVPVNNLICTSTTHLAMISALEKESAVSGFSGTSFIYDRKLESLVNSGAIKNVGEETGLNLETIFSLRPELIVFYGIDSESAGYTGRFEEAGIKTLFNADFLETDPLGKAEWIKFFGALFCLENRADSIYAEIESSYTEIKDYITENLTTKPLVLLGLPFRDTWYVSPGNSYAAQLVNDAGGKYLWSETRSAVTMPLSLENVYVKSLQAEFWLNTGSATSSAEIKSFDVRLASLPPFIKGKMYNNNKRLSLKGGNDYWESGVLNPHIILKDIASVLHPELFPDHQLVYYAKIR